jgi:hypothetical protein
MAACPPVRLCSWVEATSKGREGKATARAHHVAARVKAMRVLPNGMPKYGYLIPVAPLWLPSEVRQDNQARPDIAYALEYKMKK